MNTIKQFKKGDLVTRIGSWDHTGTVFATHYVVSSWGKKQATLVKVNDGTNAKFRVYTADAERIQGIRSSRIIATADYTEALAMAFAVECIADEDKLAIERMGWATERNDARNLEHERGVYARHKATPWQPKVIQK